MDENLNEMQTFPKNANCSGGSLKIPNLAKGNYTVRVYNFGGSDSGHEQIWMMNSYAVNEKVELYKTKDPYA